MMNLSGKCPKIPDIVQTLYLKLGPIFSTDEFAVETIDHTRLVLRVSYNWKFDLKRGDEVNAQKVFNIRDFIGDLTLKLGSKIRSYIAIMTFEEFHKNSDRIIKKSVFGDGQTTLTYDSGLIVQDVDIQSVSPADPNTQKLLQKSVSLAIELATKTIEQEYIIQSLIKNQEFKGELEKLEMNNQIEFLKKEIHLTKSQIDSDTISKTGLSRAQAIARKEATLIEYTSNRTLAEMDKQAYQINQDFELKKINKVHENEYLLTQETQRLNLKELCEKNSIETTKFKGIMNALGQDTLRAISAAGPELQAKLLEGLNLNGYIVTNGNNPINLFNVAESMTKKA
jgi:major vault protein